MNTRNELGRRAVTEALRLRSRYGRAASEPVCPVDLALEIGVDVRFEPIGSLEGMYTPDEPLIVVGSLRPPGRRTYTCAHELGHHVFGHGLRIDQMLEDTTVTTRKDDDEYLADRFAAALLMPKLAILHAFSVRGWDIAACSAEQAFTIAGVFGVGYTTLVGYLERTLRALDPDAARCLRADTPKAIRSRILGRDSTSGLIVVDEFWQGRPVDCEVGDALLVPSGAHADGSAIERAEDRHLVATRAGVVRLMRDAWAIDVRVARPNYAGLAAYRHLEDADDD